MADLDRRQLTFLTESNAIEDIHNIDYTDPANCQKDRGHVGALLRALAMARGREPLSVADVCQWQGLLAEEQLRFGHAIPAQGVGHLRGPEAPYNVRVASHVAPAFEEVPELAAAWVADLNHRLQEEVPNRYTSPVLTADLLGEFFQRFEAMHPFVDGNGRTGRLVAGYIAAWCGAPLIVFRADERPAFYAAHASKLAMRAFMAEKLREAVYNFSDQIGERIEKGLMSDRYDMGDGQELIMEWHELIEAQVGWQAAAARRAARG